MKGRDELRLLDHRGLRRFKYLEGWRRGPQIESWPADGQQAEMIMVSAVPWRRTRAAIAGFAEVVACFMQTRGGPAGRISRIETLGGGRDVGCDPMAENPGWRAGVLDEEHEAAGPSGTPDHDNGGEMSAPSQLYCAGISLPGGIAGLASIRGMAISALPEFPSPDRDTLRVS